MIENKKNKKYEEVEIVGKTSSQNRDSGEGNAFSSDFFHKRNNAKNQGATNGENSFSDIFAEVGGENFSAENIQMQMKKTKRAIMWKALLAGLPYILLTILVFVGIFLLIFILFANPFDYIIAGLLGFVLLRGVFKLRRFLK